MVDSSDFWLFLFNFITFLSSPKINYFMSKPSLQTTISPNNHSSKQFLQTTILPNNHFSKQQFHSIKQQLLPCHNSTKPQHIRHFTTLKPQPLPDSSSMFSLWNRLMSLLFHYFTVPLLYHSTTLLFQSLHVSKTTLYQIINIGQRKLCSVKERAISRNELSRNELSRNYVSRNTLWTTLQNSVSAESTQYCIVDLKAYLYMFT